MIPARSMLLAVLLPLLPACRWVMGEDQPELVVLTHEVEDLRDAVARLERGDPVLPSDDVVVVFAQSFVEDLLVAQLPFEVDIDRFHVRLDRAEVVFAGSTALRLEGSVASKQSGEPFGQVRVLGALDDIAVDLVTGTLGASVRVDQVELLKVSGAARVLKIGKLAGLGSVFRTALQNLIPRISIPVETEQEVVLPAVTEGPVRVDGATMRIQSIVSGVFAGLGQLFVALHVQLGEPVRTIPPSPPQPPPSPERGP